MVAKCLHMLGLRKKYPIFSTDTQQWIRISKYSCTLQFHTNVLAMHCYATSAVCVPVNESQTRPMLTFSEVQPLYFSTLLIQWRSQVFDPGGKTNFVTNPQLSQFFAKTPSVPQPRPLPPGSATALTKPHTLFNPYKTYYLTGTTEPSDKWPWTLKSRRFQHPRRDVRSSVYCNTIQVDFWVN